MPAIIPAHDKASHNLTKAATAAKSFDFSCPAARPRAIFDLFTAMRNGHYIRPEWIRVEPIAPALRAAAILEKAFGPIHDDLVIPLDALAKGLYGS